MISLRLNLLMLCMGIPLQTVPMQPTLDFANENKIALTSVASMAAIGYILYKTVPSFIKTWHQTKNQEHFNAIHWDWNTINTDTINDQPIAGFFKQHALNLANHSENRTPEHNQWLWGTATSAHQVEGDCTNNQWYLFENKVMENKVIEPAGRGCQSPKNEDVDIALMKELGTNCHRFSIEWSKIYPQEGIIDQQELLRYENFCKKLVANGIKPVITLYHYTEPIWFYQKGGFEESKNNRHFVDFCCTVIERLNPYVYLWLTFNSPEGVAAQGWLTATKPPAKKNMKLMVQVLHNLLEAHVAVYRAAKLLPGCQNSRIGMLKNIMQLDPWDVTNPLDQFGCGLGNYLVNDSIYNYFKTGTFEVKLPFRWLPIMVNYNQTNEYIKNGGTCLDFIGLNYYCHNYMSKFKTFREPNQAIEIHTNNDKYTIYGEGLYRAIEELSNKVAKPFNIPIYITENGIGTDNDDHRVLHNQRYLYALARAIEDGHDVRGYIHWSLMDNYEWGQYSKHYGLIAVNRDTMERIKKPSAWYYEKIMKESKI
jgi:beta-glucosidase